MNIGFTSSKTVTFDDNYNRWLSSLRERFQQAQIKASVKVNTILLEFYWQMGGDIMNMCSANRYGSDFFNRLSLDLRKSFPSQKGFSVTNLKYIARWVEFYRHYPNRHQLGDDSKMPEEFGLIPWRHHIEIFTHSKTIEEALYFINQCIRHNWSRSVLSYHIQVNDYQRVGKAITNFSKTLPAPQGELAQSILKDPYNLDFLNLDSVVSEKELENLIAKNITRFLLEMGDGFAFVGRQKEIKMPNGKSYFPDLLFYHIPQKRYLIIELKVVDFKPEHMGQLNFYVSAVDELLKSEDDNETIGLLVCKSKDQLTVEWTIRDMTAPLGVASYCIGEVVQQSINELKAKK